MLVLGVLVLKARHIEDSTEKIHSSVISIMLMVGVVEEITKLVETQETVDLLMVEEKLVDLVVAVVAPMMEIYIFQAQDLATLILVKVI
jgi:hypothetical protein